MSLRERAPAVPRQRFSSFKAWRSVLTCAGVSGGNSASQSLTSTGTSTGPALRLFRRCSLIAAASSLAGASPDPTSRTQSVTSGSLAFIAPAHVSATAVASTSGTNFTKRRTLSSAFLNSPRFGLVVTATSKPLTCPGSGVDITSSIAAFMRERLAFFTKSTPASGEVGRAGGGLDHDDDEEEDEEEYDDDD